MRRSLLLPLLAAGLVLGAAACSSDDESSSTTTTTAAETTTTTEASGTTSTGGDTTSTTDAAPTPCTADTLSGELGPPNSGAGQVYNPLVLRNTGTSECVMRGFPGVSLLDAGGSQIGEPATREGSEGASVTLTPGAAASVTLHTANEGLGAPCDPTSAEIRVFPPDQTEALTFSAAYTACGGFTVSTLVAGEDGI
jgi:ABC-type transport system substrate-binding protein